MTNRYNGSHTSGRLIITFVQTNFMRGLPRMLMMFAPMIFRAASKYYNKWQANRQQEEFSQSQQNHAKDKINPDGTTYKKEDMV